MKTVVRTESPTEVQRDERRRCEATFAQSEGRLGPTLVVAGELDLAVGASLRQALGVLVARASGPVYVDLTAVGFMDSTGVNALLQARRSGLRTGAVLRVVDASTPCRRVLDVCGVWDLLAGEVMEQSRRLTSDHGAPTGATSAPNGDRAEHPTGADAARTAGDERIADLVREVEGLKTAMEHRATIEQAKGVIMATMRCGPEEAFALLVTQSQQENRKLWQIAAHLVRVQRHEPPATSSTALAQVGAAD
jgi:anti-anti-sigma factor